MSRIMKQCSKCKRWLDENNFYKRNDLAKTKLRSQCIECYNNYYRERKAEKREYNRVYRETHLEKLREKEKKYYQQNKKKKLAYQKRYNTLHEDEIKEYEKNYRKEHPELLVKGKKYRGKHREKAKKYSKKYYNERSDAITLQKRMRYQNDKDYRQKIQLSVKKYGSKHKEKLKNKDKIYRMKNREKIKIYQRKYVASHKETINANKREKRHNNPKIRLDMSMKNNIGRSLNGRKNGKKWEILVGYTCKDLMTHLESRFNPKMNWDGMGNYWHLDHIIPLAYFRYENADSIEFKMAWGLNNLQPLEKMANIKKGKKLILPDILNNKDAIKTLIYLLECRDVSLKRHKDILTEDNLKQLLIQNGFRCF